MKRLVSCSLLLAMGAALFGGCSESRVRTNDKGGVEGTTSAPPSSAPQAEVQLQSVSCVQWDKELASQRGKIVVVDTWATWCAPCVEEFPQLVILHGKHARDGVACMSVSVDEPAKRGDALDFLKKREAVFSNYIIDDVDDAWWDKWQIKAIPIVLVFDREGKLVRKFDKDDPDNQFSYEDVEKLVAELLQQSSAKRSS